MKKLFTLLVIVVVSGVAQGQEITRGRFVDSSTMLTTYFYLWDDGTKFFWGCHDSVVKYTPYTKVYSITSEDGTVMTLIPLKNRTQQNLLSYALSRYVIDDNLTSKEAFEKIFSFYRKYESVYPDWTVILLTGPEPKTKKI